MDFFTSYELEDMITSFVDKTLKLPKRLQGPSNDWNIYISNTLHKLYREIYKYYKYAMIGYVTLHIVLAIVSYYLMNRRGTENSYTP